MNKNWQSKLEDKIKKYLAGYSACHDFYHLERVKNYSLETVKEVNCDKDILIAATLLHDVGYKNNEHDDQNHHLYSIKIAKKWLPEVGFPKEKDADVLEAILLHDNFRWDEKSETTSHIASLIIQDADRIDALGATGIARIIYYYGEKSWPIYNPDPVSKSKKVWLNHSLLNQMKRDPMKKWQNMNFEISKKISKKRANFLKEFYKELKKELEFHHKR